MSSYISMYTRSQNGIKMRMETTIGLYGKGNEITSQHLMTFAMSRIVLCFEWQLLLHAMSSSKHVAPNFYKLDRQ